MDIEEYKFSIAELAQLHRNLGHTPAGSMYSASRHPIETGASDQEKIFEVASQCKKFHLFTKQLNRSRAALAEQCTFNFDVALDIMFIRQVPILHVVCKTTHLFCAAVIPKQDSSTMWITSMTIWVGPHTGGPHSV